MPTGLTSQLDDNQLTTQRWILESLALQFFGAFYDTGFGRTEEQLQKAIARDYSGFGYYIEKYEEAKVRKYKIEKWTPEQWKEEYDSMVRESILEIAESTKRCAIAKARHCAVRAELEKLLNSSTAEIVQTIAKYGMKQLDEISSEDEPYIPRIPTPREYAREQKRNISRDLKYFSEKIDGEKKMVSENLVAYQALREETHRILDTPK